MSKLELYLLGLRTRNALRSRPDYADCFKKVWSRGNCCCKSKWSNDTKTSISWPAAT